MNAKTLRTTISIALAALIPFAIGLRVHRQGLDLVGDGLWLLGAQLFGDGGHLYTGLVTRDGPSDYAALAGLFAILGSSAWTLAILKSVLDGILGAAGFAWARSRGAHHTAWLVPLGAIALGPFPPRYVGAVVLAWLVDTTIKSWQRDTASSDARSTVADGRGVVAGALAAGLMLAGLDGAALAVGILAFGLATAKRAGLASSARRGLAMTAAGAGAVLLATGAVGAAQGWLGAAFDQVVGLGMDRFGAQLAAIPGHRLVSALWTGGGQDQPFAQLTTGEHLEALWTGQGFLRGLGFRSLLVGLFAVPVLAWWRAPRGDAAPAGERPSDGIAVGLAATLALGALLRDEPGFVLAASVGVLCLLPNVVDRLGAGRWRLAGLGVALLTLLPFVVENGWLATHPTREGLVAWNRPRTSVAVAGPRVAQLEAMFGALAPGPGLPEEPMLIWPDQPGFHYFFQLPWAVPQVVLRPGWIPRTEPIAKDLAEARPRQVLLRLSPQFDGRAIDALAPGTWSYLRANYVVEGNVQGPAGRFRALSRYELGDDSLRALPLVKQLADNQQSVANDFGPVMRPELAVGQSFVVGESDLRGFSVQWKSEDRPVTVPVRLSVWMQTGDRLDTLIEFFDVKLQIPSDRHRSYFQFDPIEGTAGQRVAVNLELQATTEQELRLVWHSPGKGHDTGDDAVDFYAEGSAVLDLQPVDADLYFFSW